MLEQLRSMQEETCNMLREVRGSIQGVGKDSYMFLQTFDLPVSPLSPWRQLWMLDVSCDSFDRSSDGYSQFGSEPVSRAHSLRKEHWVSTTRRRLPGSHSIIIPSTHSHKLFGIVVSPRPV